MNMISWQEIAVRLLFAFILGSATAIDKKWYQTKQSIQSTTLMALGAAMFSLLVSSTSEARFSADLIIAIGIVCAGVSFQQQVNVQSLSIEAVMRLWFAGAVGSMVGFGFFVPAYFGILIVILTNLLFSTSEKRFTSNLKQVLERNLESDSELESDPELESEEKTATPRESYYRCKIQCGAVDEAEVLALLIQLSNDRKLMPTKISSRNLTHNDSDSEIEIQVDFVSRDTTDTLQLQQVVMSLKSKLAIVSASWVCLPSESLSKNDEATLTSAPILPKS